MSLIWLKFILKTELCKEQLQSFFLLIFFIKNHVHWLTGKTSSGLMQCDFIQIVKSSWIHGPRLLWIMMRVYQCEKWCFPDTHWASGYLTRRMPLWTHFTPPAVVIVRRHNNNPPHHKARVMKSTAHENENKFSELQWPPQLPDQYSNTALYELSEDHVVRDSCTHCSHSVYWDVREPRNSPDNVADDHRQRSIYFFPLSSKTILTECLLHTMCNKTSLQYSRAPYTRFL